MTRTEERLADALRASAGRVRDDRLRPLPAAGPPARKAWLAPAAAAASVVLVIVLAVALAGGHPARRPSAGHPGVPATFPKYFAEFTASQGQLSMEVRSTSTGALVAQAPAPTAPGWSLDPGTIAAAPDGRTFYVDCGAVPLLGSPGTRQVWIYRLSVASDGKATPLTRIMGVETPGDAVPASGGNMAVSPDGTELALTAGTARQPGPTNQGWADKIIVVGLLTGARSVWQGGMSRPGQTLVIPHVSWTRDGRSLVFPGLWCTPVPESNVCRGTPGQLGYRGLQVRSIDVAAGGGTLDRGALLLTQSARYPVIADAVAGPEGELTLAVLSGSAGASGAELAVERVSAATGSLLGVAYRSAAYGTEGLPTSVTIIPDATGQYLALGYVGWSGPVGGWIDHGRLRLLPVQHPQPALGITAW